MDNLEQRSVHPEQLHNYQTPEHKDGGFEGISQENVSLNANAVPKEVGNVAIDIASMGLESGNKNIDARGGLELPDHAKAKALEHLLNDGELSLSDSTGAQELMDKVNGIMGKQ